MPCRLALLFFHERPEHSQDFSDHLLLIVAAHVQPAPSARHRHYIDAAAHCEVAVWPVPVFVVGVLGARLELELKPLSDLREALHARESRPAVAGELALNQVRERGHHRFVFLGVHGYFDSSSSSGTSGS